MADEAGIRDLDRLKRRHRRPRRPTSYRAPAADRLIQKARLSTTSTPSCTRTPGSDQAMLETAYRLAVSEQPMIRRIREQLVVLINPVSWNPDGRDKVVEWSLPIPKSKDRPSHSAAPVPALLVEVPFVDINRDTHQQPTRPPRQRPYVSRVAPDCGARPARRRAPSDETWNAQDPTTRNVDPITYPNFFCSEFHEVQTLTAMGCPVFLPGISVRPSRTLSHLRGDEPQQHGRGYGRPGERHQPKP